MMLTYAMMEKGGKLEWTPFANVDEAKGHAIWGTFGKHGVKHCQGTCPQHQLRYVKLVDCETPHLLAILGTQPQITTTAYPKIIEAILIDRGFTKGQVEDAVEAIRSV